MLRYLDYLDLIEVEYPPLRAPTHIDAPSLPGHRGRVASTTDDEVDDPTCEKKPNGDVWDSKTLPVRCHHVPRPDRYRHAEAQARCPCEHSPDPESDDLATSRRSSRTAGGGILVAHHLSAGRLTIGTAACAELAIEVVEEQLIDADSPAPRHGWAGVVPSLASMWARTLLRVDSSSSGDTAVKSVSKPARTIASRSSGLMVSISCAVQILLRDVISER